MSHLSLETIARLVDEQPSALDNAHLESCAACRAELDAMRADITALGELPDVLPAPDSWDVIESRLEAEGLLSPRMNATPARARWNMPLTRAAAIALVFAGGAAAGHAWSRVSVAPTVNAPPAVSQVKSAATTPAPVTDNTTADMPGQVARAESAVVQQPTVQTPRTVRLASTGSSARNADEPAGGASADAALRTLREAEDRYFSALSNYSAKAGTESSDPNARLAALEGIVLTTRAALAQSPTDPVINGYHLTALAQRDAMLKQIKANPATSW